MLDPDSTGALCVFAFHLDDDGAARECHVRVSRHETEEDLIEERTGPVEPGRHVVWRPHDAPAPDLFSARPETRPDCWLSADEIPAEWLASFPGGADIIRKSIEMRPDSALGPDRRLLRRRDCEFELYRSVENAVELPVVRGGFETVEQFVARAQSVLQRRKSRSGRSLELHLKAIFQEEGLREGRHFAFQPETEPGCRPDFLFPDADSYKDTEFPVSRIRMLAVKTTCRDRWRQVLNEAARIDNKHLFTLQEGVSEGQFREMTEAGVHLVVPEPRLPMFPASVRPHLQTLESFIGDIRVL